jgi:hypothetical protein
MTKLPRWWWISMALWPITGVPVIAYFYIWFGHLPGLRSDQTALSPSDIVLLFAIYHPLILLPFALAQRVILDWRSNA